MRQALIAFLGLFLLIGAAKPEQPILVPTVQERALASLVKVTHPNKELDEDGDKTTSVCGGFVLNTSLGDIMTAQHCVDPEMPSSVDGRPARLIRWKDGFALLAIIPDFMKPQLDISTRMPDFDEELLTVGYGYTELTMLRVRVGMMPHLEGIRHIGVYPPLIKGMSGGPVLDMRGKVVGMNQATTDQIGFICSGREMKAFLDSKGDR